MEKEEHKAILDKIKSATTDVDRMQLLVELEQDYATVLAETETAKTELVTAQETASKYAKLNNELWLANSVQANANEQTDKIGAEPEIEVAEKRTFEDLESKF